MARGDQVYVMREVLGIPGVYEHHGIDCGDGTIIHYRKMGEAQVTRTSRAAFAQGQRIYVKPQPVEFIPDVVVARAESRLGERRYDLFSNNCEHFATWCKTGQNESVQVAGFGRRVDQLNPLQAKQLMDRMAQEKEPADAIALFNQALGNVAIAHQRLQPQIDQAQHEVNTWHRTAQLALTKGREDLSRAALGRKVAAKKRLGQLQQQLVEVQALEASLQQQCDRAQQQI